MLDSEVHGHIKLDKLWIPNQLLSMAVKDSKDLTTLAMFVMLHFSSKSGVIKFHSVKEACGWFGISNSTYYEIRKRRLFEELFEVEKGYFKAKSLRNSKYWVGALIALNGRFKTTEDYRLGVDITKESLNSIQGIKEVLRRALLVSTISSMKAKCEGSGTGEKIITCCQGKETELGKRVSVAGIDGNVKPIAYFSKILGCSDTKTRELLHKSEELGDIGIQAIRKVTHESEIKEEMVSANLGLYDVLDAAGKWNFDNTYGKTAMPSFGVFITQLPNRYWIKQRKRVEMPDGSVRKHKKRIKSIHVPDYLWNPKYGTKTISNPKGKREEEERKLTLEERYRMIEENISRIRSEAKKKEDGLIHYNGFARTEQEFEDWIKDLRRINRARERDNVSPSFEKGKIYESKIPNPKPVEKIANIDYRSLKEFWTPVPKDDHGYPNYSVVSKNVERYDRYMRLSEEERNHLDKHPEIDLSTEEGRREMQRQFKAEKSWRMTESMKKRYDKIKWVISYAKRWSYKDATRIVGKFMTAYDYFKESGRSLQRRIAIAERNIGIFYKEDIERERDRMIEGYLREADEAHSLGDMFQYCAYSYLAENVSYVDVRKRSVEECLSDDEEKDLIDKEVIMGSYLSEILFTYHTEGGLEKTLAGVMLQGWHVYAESERNRKKEERMMRKEEKERLKQEKARNKKRRKEEVEIG